VKNAAGVTRERVVFHSTRKVTNTLLERAEVHASLVETIMGHQRAWTFQAYSQGVTLGALKEAIEKIEIPEIVRI
jgi:integrase